MKRAIITVSRLIWILLAATCSLCCVLAYVPFTYQQIVQGKLIGAVTQFAAIQPWVFWAAFALCAMTLIPALRAGRRTLLAALLFLIPTALFGLFLAFNSPLAKLGKGTTSLYWAFGFLLPALLLAGFDIAWSIRKVQWQTRPLPADRRVFRAACLTALFTTVLFTAVAGLFEPWLMVASAASQFTVFLLFFAAVTAISGATAKSFYPARSEFFSLEVLGALLLFSFFNGKVLAAISFSGVEAAVYAAALSIAAILTVTGLSLSIAAVDPEPVQSGLDLVFLPMMFSLGGNRLLIGAALALLATGGAVMARYAADFDWNYVLQQCVVAFVWVVAFTLFYAIPSNLRPRRDTLLLLSTAIVSLILLRAIPLRPEAAERYAGVNISFRLARDVLSPPGVDRSFYNLLNQSSNIGRSVDIKPVQYRIVPNFQPRTGARPNIFVIVVDSLRKDYLSPYNPTVTFTPAIDEFAHDAVVMQHGFTQYSGRGLSEPSIWAGGMLVHKQYVKPFFPMNTLQTLVNGDGYRSFVSMDNILETVTPKTANLMELDAGRFTTNFDLCHSLDELQSNIQPGSPIFAYTQPQNLNSAAIARQGKTVASGESYPGFYAPYASRLKRMDSCFGQFISSLKAKNLYDSSIIILTSDHGESLGEEGQFGHTFSLRPEVVQIPLLIHLPKEISAKVIYSKDRPAFTTDITPTLYYLLGHTAVINDPLMGRPLFTYRAAQQDTYNRADYLLAASDAAVYGLLTDQGQTLYVADGLNEEDSLYDLPDGTAQRITPRTRTAARKEIARLLAAINSRFGFSPHN